jgi:hydrogenase-4 component B
MALVVTAANMITFMLCWEIMSSLRFSWWSTIMKTDENRKAGYLYFIFSQVGAMVHTGSLWGDLFPCRQLRF